MSELPKLPLDMIYEIYLNVGTFTRAKASLVDPQIRIAFPDTPPLSHHDLEKIEYYSHNEKLVIDGKEIVTALGLLAPFKSELAHVVKIYTTKLAYLMRGLTTPEIRTLFGIIDS